MRILQGQDLVNELRRLSESITKRLWISVPYIGSPTSLRRVLGKHWFESPSVNVQLLTDISDLSGINSETLEIFYDRGKVKTLTGLHAKIYIIDDSCLITSANLTNTAFTKRHEIGIFIPPGKQANQIIEMFSEWWKKSANVKSDQLAKIFSKKKKSKGEIGISFPTLFALPNDPGSFSHNLSKKFLNYDRLLADYEDFAMKYSSIQRIWKNKPLYFEIDGLFNFLYHVGLRPSNKYSKKSPRYLSEVEQLNEIRKWAIKYKEWNNNEYSLVNGEDDIDWRIRRSKTLKRLLSPRKVLKLTKTELDDAFHCLNSLNSYPINRTKILNNNSVSKIRIALNQLVNGKGQLAARMDFCNSIKNLGTSSMNEVLGFTNPYKYPLINRNSNCGLRFFGYQVRLYN
jgi:hypothetical protein